MSIGINSKSKYLPIGVAKFPDGTIQGTPDYMRASYINLHQNVTNFTQFLLSQDLEGRPDLLSYRFYGDATLWWAICLYNGIINPFKELIPGMVIKIPDYAEMMAFLNTSSSSTSAAVNAAPVYPLITL